jgi:WD40 repeat protein
MVVTASKDNTAKVWDINNMNDPICILRHGDQVYNARFNNEGTMVVTASWDKTAKVWGILGSQMVKSASKK